MTWFLFIPFSIQSICMFVDEFHFHIKRGLPKWERIGHPIDTLSVIVCLLYLIWVPFSSFNFFGYMLLSLISSLLITKDEWVHKEHCKGTEQWLHALLFINHPILLISFGLMWVKQYSSSSNNWVSWFDHSPLFVPFFLSSLILMVLFCIYQVVFWNLLWKKD